MFDAFVKAVLASGGELAPIDEASALIWADPASTEEFHLVVEDATELEWVQLPYAGVEKFAPNLIPDLIWTCGKGVYADPVAEHVMALILAAFRNLHVYAAADSWTEQVGRNLRGASVTVIGGGGIARSLIGLLEPWDTAVTVVRRTPEPVPGATATLTMEHLNQAISDTDVVVLAASLTADTHHLVDADFLAAMARRAWLVNVARGGLVATDDLVDALRHNEIAGAALDVTDPEPLPGGHPLFGLHNCIITPHVGNTPEMGLPLITDRVARNVARWIAGDELLGLVDVVAGY